MFQNLFAALMAATACLQATKRPLTTQKPAFISLTINLLMTFCRLIALRPYFHVIIPPLRNFAFGLFSIFYRCMKNTLFTLLAFFTIGSARAKNTDTISVYFRLAIPSLDVTASHTLDSVIYYDILQPGKKIGIIGYADYLGSEQANVGLSTARAENVKTYLVGMGIAEKDIQTVIGKGEVPRPGMTTPDGYAPDRRVDIVLGGFKTIDTPKAQPPKTEAPKPAKGIDITKLKKNETIVLENIYFHPGSHRMRDISMPALRLLYNTMKENPTLKISIEGHICCQPTNVTDGYDYDSEDHFLSRNRAMEIYGILKERGISEDRMQFKGFGKTKPLVEPEMSVEDENKNRRVEIRILEK